MIIRIKKIFVLKKSSYNHPWQNLNYQDMQSALIKVKQLNKLDNNKV